MGPARIVLGVALAILVAGGGRSGASKVPEPSLAAATGLQADAAAAGPAYGTYGWPIDGPVLRPFEPPESPYGAGHRGIDIGAPAGTTARAAADGVVAFAGQVAGSRFVSVDHPDGVRTTYSWLSSVVVRAGDPVRRGDPVGDSGPGHPGTSPPHLHFGARFGGGYLDPMLLLEHGGVVGLIRLAPVEEATVPGAA